MALSQRNCVLLLLCVAAVCIELYQATYVVGRCRCHKYHKIQSINITDFQVYKPWAGCPRNELIVTRIKLDNSTDPLCINPNGQLGTNILTCWKKINEDKSRKMECMEN